jgi:hypothetical protein
MRNRIRPINFSKPADKDRHDKMVELVDRMLELNKQKHSGKLAPSQVARVDREIAATDAGIDNLVYAGGAYVPHYGMYAISKPGIKVRDAVGGR